MSLQLRIRRGEKISLFDSKRGLKCFYPWDQMLHLSKLVAFMDRHKVIYNSFLCSNSAKYFPGMKEMVTWKEHVGLHLGLTQARLLGDLIEQITFSKTGLIPEF